MAGWRTWRGEPSWRFMLVAMLVVVALAGLRWWRRRPPPSLEVFDAGLTLPLARLASSKLDKPVLVFATADWCGPCQRLKRNTLTNQRVEERILELTVPVYLDVTNGVPREAAELGVKGIPALIVLEDGREISRVVGYRSEGELLRWLDSL